MRRRVPPAGSLVSLLDVLFILVFASLIQSQARGAAAGAQPDVLPPPPPVPVQPVPAPPAALAAVRAAAADAAARHVGGAPLVVVRIAPDGTLVEIEREGEKRAVGVPLLERVDEDVKLGYLGDRTPAMQICGVVARELRAADLAGQVIVIAPSIAMRELPAALAPGLRRDVERCTREQHALALVVEPDMVK